MQVSANICLIHKVLRKLLRFENIRYYVENVTISELFIFSFNFSETSSQHGKLTVSTNEFCLLAWKGLKMFSATCNSR